MGKETTYNGFTNYETWAVSLWLGNDYAGYQRWRACSRLEWANARQRRAEEMTPRQAAAIALADRVKAEVEDRAPLTDASLYTDLLRAALSQVDWYEVAENLLEDAIEQEQR